LANPRHAGLELHQHAHADPTLPEQRPQRRTPCNLPEGTSCPPSSCAYLTGPNVRCTGGFWRWSSQNMCPVCASPDTPIATPSGDRPIAGLRVGDLVYSRRRRRHPRRAHRRINQTPVAGHHVGPDRDRGRGARSETSAPAPHRGRDADSAISALATGSTAARSSRPLLIPYRFTGHLRPSCRSHESGTYFAPAC
jgi:hypothetical protein